MKTLTRQQVAEVCHVTTRTVTRWADTGILSKYVDVMNRVVFDAEQVGRIVSARALEISNLVLEIHSGQPPAPPPQRRRW